MKLLSLNNKPLTFGGKVAMSTNSRLAQCVTAFISIASGAQHIGAVQNFINIFSKLNSVEEAKSLVLKLLSEKKKVPGFGHAFFEKQNDPRFELFEWKLPQIKIKENSITLHKILQEIIKMMSEDKGFILNVDFYNAMRLNLVVIPYDLFFNCLLLNNGKTSWFSFSYFRTKGKLNITIFYNN